MLGHDRKFIYEPRGFTSVEEMNEGIVERWNSVVGEDDTIYILGDLMLGTDHMDGIALLNRLKGKKIVILGNHDTVTRQKAYKLADNLEIHGWAEMVRIGKRDYYLSHYPTMTNNFDERHPFNLYGHTHQTDNFYMDRPMNYHVGVDSHKSFPVSIEQIEYDIKEKIKEATEIVEPKDARWEIDSDGYYPYCSKCSFEPEKQLTPFCPKCGSYMSNFEELKH